MNLKRLFVPITFFIVAILVLIHQYIIADVWWQWEDIHHEAFIIALVFGGIVLYFVQKKIY